MFSARKPPFRHVVSAPLLVCWLAACGGGDSGLGGLGSDVGSSSNTATYSIGGNVTGLTGSGLVLQDGAGDTAPVDASGAFSFSSLLGGLASGTTYQVTVSTQPTNPSQTCVVANGSGTISNANITNVSVSCTTNKYTVSATVSGLASRSTLVLQNNGGDSLTITANGSATFSTSILSGETYDVTVSQQPSSPTQSCVVTGGSGTVTAAAVTSVSIACTAGGPTLSGKVQSGQSGSAPMAGATVTLYAAGTSASQLGTATTASDGSFSISYNCPSGNSLLYVTAAGGSTVAGAKSNPYSLTASALGSCTAVSAAPSSIVVDELTTAAVAYALNRFANQSAGSPPTILIEGKSPGLDNAFTTAANLADPRKGVVANATTATNMTSYVAPLLTTVANALAACTSSNNTSAESSACVELLSCAQQRAEFQANGQPCTAASQSLQTQTTFGAAVSIAQNAGLVSSSGLFDVANQSSAYSGGLSSAPPDWTVILSFNLPNSGSIAVDAQGNVWTLAQNSRSQLAMMELAPGGTSVPGQDGYTASGITGSGYNTGLAIDATGNVWVGGTGAISKFSPAGTLLANFTNQTLASGLKGTYPLAGMAFDGAGNLWLSSAGSPDVVELSQTGQTLSGANGFGVVDGHTVTSANSAASLAMDTVGNTWFTFSPQDGYVGQMNSQGAITQYLSPIPANQHNFSAIAVDPTNAVWAVDALTNAVYFFSPASGGGYGPSMAINTGGISAPSGIALDAAGDAWITNGDNTAASSKHLTEIAPNGTPLNAAAGLGSAAAMDGAVGGPYGVAVDPSGNVWVATNGSAVYEFVGCATPTRTPIVSTLTLGFKP